MEELDELIFNIIESLRNNKNQLLWKIKRTTDYHIRQKKLWNKPHGGKNSYFKTQKNDNLSPQIPLLPTQLPKTPIINKNKNINIETNISEKLKG